METKLNIILLGATGFTGQLIAENLCKACIPFCLSGRSNDKLTEIKAKLKTNLPVLNLDINNKTETENTLKKFDLIINCIGPFNLYGANVLNFCIENGKTYIDITGEQNFVKNSMERNDEAKQSNATIIHSVSFESCLADLMASQFLDTSLSYSDISTYYSFSKSKPSKGTRLTMQISKHFPSFNLINGQYNESASLSFSEDVVFDIAPFSNKAFFMPYPEVLFFKKKYNIGSSASFLLVNNSEAFFLKGASSEPGYSIETILKKPVLQHHHLSPVEKSSQQFTLTLKAILHDGHKFINHITGQDMYGLTAYLVSRSVSKISEGMQLPKGVITPSEMGGWEGIWEELKKEKYIN